MSSVREELDKIVYRHRRLDTKDTTLRAMLTGQNPNKTNLIII